MKGRGASLHFPSPLHIPITPPPSTNSFSVNIPASEKRLFTLFLHRCADHNTFPPPLNPTFKPTSLTFSRPFISPPSSSHPPFFLLPLPSPPLILLSFSSLFPYLLSFSLLFFSLFPHLFSSCHLLLFSFLFFPSTIAFFHSPFSPPSSLIFSHYPFFSSRSSLASSHPLTFSPPFSLTSSHLLSSSFFSPPSSLAFSHPPSSLAFSHPPFFVLAPSLLLYHPSPSPLFLQMRK